MASYEQLSLFDVHHGNPTWDDVQKGRATFVRHDAYSRRCRESCLHSGSIFDMGGERTCYLFRKPVRDGMCPSTGEIEWNL